MHIKLNKPWRFTDLVENNIINVEVADLAKRIKGLDQIKGGLANARILIKGQSKNKKKFLAKYTISIH